MRDGELFGQMLAQRLNPVAFRGVMSGSEIMNAGFPRDMHGLLGNLATDEGIQPPRCCRLDPGLGRPGAPAHGFDTLRCTGNVQRHPAQPLLDMRRQRRAVERRRQAPILPQLQVRLTAEAALWLKIQDAGQLCIVTQPGMRIQRQMVCQQTNLLPEQAAQAALLHAGDTGILPLPEIPVVHQQRIGAGLDGRLDQRHAGRHTADQPPHFLAPLDLQAVGTIVAETVNTEQSVRVFNKILQNYHGVISCSCEPALYIQWPIDNNVFPVMPTLKIISFIAQTITAGLAAAFLYILLVQPDLLRGGSKVVEVRETLPQEAPAQPPAGNIPGPHGSGPASYADAVALAAPAVVNVHTAKVITRRVHPLLDDPIFQHFFGDRFQQSRKAIQTSLGSGVIISAQGYILTNNHVIDGADEIRVLLADGRSSRATVVGTDVDTDLAVLHVEIDDLPSIVIGDSRKLRVGDISLAIGNPFGVGQTVTFGIISATGRDQLGITAYEEFIQTDAAINPGNSGGALINAAGELIGINSAIYSRTGGSQGIGFAIPISLAKGVMTQIIEQGHVVRGWLGIEAQDLTPQLAESFGADSTSGVLIAGVLSEGPADKAGLLPGDIVTSVNDSPVPDATAAMKVISEQPPGSMIELQGLREGQPFKLRVRVSERPGKARQGATRS
jgi:serine protease DegS